MKALFLSLMLMSSMANAEPEAVKCNVVKTTFHLYMTKHNAQKIVKCFTPGCVVGRTVKTEKSFCKAVKNCDVVELELNNPCDANNRLTPEARKAIIETAKDGWTIAVDLSLELIRLIKGGKPEEEEAIMLRALQTAEAEDEAIEDV